jgi:hypothetical protein
MSEVIHAPLGRDSVFEPEDIAQLAASLESALTHLGVKDRNDPMTNSARLHLAAKPARARLDEFLSG